MWNSSKKLNRIVLIYNSLNKTLNEYDYMNMNIKIVFAPLTLHTFMDECNTGYNNVGPTYKGLMQSNRNAMLL